MSISQQLVLDMFEVFIAETMCNLSLPIYVSMPWWLTTECVCL